MTTIADAPQAIAQINLNTFDFVDFGYSKGGFIKQATTIFGAEHGLGIVINPEEVEATRAEGYDAIVGDLTNLRIGTKKVRFAYLSHFLEHLSSLKDAERCLRSAVHVARDFVFVVQPYFNADGCLFRKGLNLFWSDWLGHPNKMAIRDFHCILCGFIHKGLIRNFAHYVLGPISNSDTQRFIRFRGRWTRASSIHPSLHPAKPQRAFSFGQPVFIETRVLIDLSETSGREAYLKRFPDSACLYDSTA